MPMNSPVNDRKVEQPPRDRRSFGNLLRIARRTRQWSQAKLAKAAGVTAVFISQIEKGVRLPSDRVAKDLAIALELPWADVARQLYRLRSPEAGDLFGDQLEAERTPYRSVTEMPPIQALLLHIAGLNLSSRDIEALVRRWTDDVALVSELRRATRQ